MFKVKRFVTGIDEDSRAVVSIDDVASNVLPIGGWPGAYITELWTTDEIPIDNSGDADRGARKIKHDPTPNGSIFRIVEIPSEEENSTPIDVDRVFSSMGSENEPTSRDSDRHGSMHFTNSIDYLIVMSGEMQMLMEHGEVLIRQGDCIVQRGVKHAWVNKSGAPCVIAAILIDAHPIVS